jgi:hypothetical protein
MAYLSVEQVNGEGGGYSPYVLCGTSVFHLSSVEWVLDTIEMVSRAPHLAGVQENSCVRLLSLLLEW